MNDDADKVIEMFRDLVADIPRVALESGRSESELRAELLEILGLTEDEEIE